MKILTIDVGNTAIKTAVFNNGTMIDFKRTEITNIHEQLKNVIGEYDKIALCTSQPSLIQEIKKLYPQIQIIDSDDYDQMIEMYLGNPPQHGSFAELGVDIALGCYGALGHSDNLDNGKDIIVIDSGTAITVTAVVSNVIEAVYIYPGFKLSKRSLFGATDALDGDYNINIKSGRAANTEACIDLAIYHGTNGAMLQIIKEIEDYYNRSFQIFITGGDSSEFYIDANIKDDKLVNIGIDRYVRNIK